MAILYLPQIANIHLLRECTFCWTLTIFFTGCVYPILGHGRQVKFICLQKLSTILILGVVVSKP